MNLEGIRCATQAIAEAAYAERLSPRLRAWTLQVLSGRFLSGSSITTVRAKTHTLVDHMKEHEIAYRSVFGSLDAADFAAVLGASFLFLGIPTRFVYARDIHRDDAFTVFLKVQEESGQWVTVDPMRDPKMVCAELGYIEPGGDPLVEVAVRALQQEENSS